MSRYFLPGQAHPRPSSCPHWLTPRRSVRQNILRTRGPQSSIFPFRLRGTADSGKSILTILCSRSVAFLPRDPILITAILRRIVRNGAMQHARKICICLIALLVLGPDAYAQQEGFQEESSTAQQLYNTGYMMTLLGRYEEAIRLYERSLEIEATAEAHTYLGWTYSHLSNYKRAIEEAEKAIRIDPEYGNPYNDIGVYLMEQGREDEAIAYLQKAMRAKRYCCYQFPHYNMGRIYLRKKKYEKARREFQKALAIDPDYAPAAEALELLEKLGIRGI